MINRDYYGLLTEKEKYYIQQIEYHSGEIPFLSIHELSQRIFTSPASLSRLVKKIGYKNYKEFRQSFIIDSNKSTKNNSLETHIDFIFNTYPQIINECVIPKILEAHRIFIVSFGPSAAIAQELGNSLNILNIDYIIIHDSDFISQLQSLITSNDIVIYISYSGSDYLMEQLAVQFKNQYQQLLFTSTLNSPLSSHVSLIINTHTDSLQLPYKSRLPLHTLVTIINSNLLKIY